MENVQHQDFIEGGVAGSSQQASENKSAAEADIVSKKSWFVVFRMRSDGRDLSFPFLTSFHS